MQASWDRVAPSASARRIAYWVGPFAFFSIVYFLTYLNSLSSTNLTAYPFGSDVPLYLYERGNPEHPLVIALLSIWRWLLGLTNMPTAPAYIKAPFALAGALNVTVAIAAFATIFDRWRVLLFGACYGCSLSVWYFGSVPESYGVSTLLYSIYLLIFLQSAKHGITTWHATLMAGTLLLALLNDASAVLLTLVPLVYYGGRAWSDRSIRTAATVQIGACLLFLVLVTAFTGFVQRYVSLFSNYAAATLGTSAPGVGNRVELLDALLNFFFFSIGAPSAEVTHASALFPSYVGFFEPSLLTYLRHPVTLLFLVFYGALLTFVRVQHTTRLMLAFLCLIGVRLALILVFNPGEAFLYTPVTTLPLLLVLFSYLESSRMRHKTAFVALLLLCTAGANFRFLF